MVGKLPSLRQLQASKRDIAEGILKEWHLCRSKLESMDMMKELEGLRSTEAKRHDFLMSTTLAEQVTRASPMGAGIRRPPTKSNQSSVPKLPPARPPTTATQEEEAAASPPRRMSLQLLSINSDPTLLPNEHIHRKKMIDDAIALQEKKLAHSRSMGALMASSKGLEKSMKWDRAPTPNGCGHSEAQCQFYPRSADACKSCGVYKEPKACRPMDHVYMHREMMVRQKHILKTK